MSLLTIANDLANMIGANTVTELRGNNSRHARRLLTFIEQAELDCFKRHNWADLTLVGAANGTNRENYNLNANFDRGIPGTTWNRSVSRKYSGAQNRMFWQTLESGVVNSSTAYVFTIRGDGNGKKQVWFKPSLPSGEQVVYEYITTERFSDGSTTHDEWLDNYTAIVPERAILWKAYEIAALALDLAKYQRAVVRANQVLSDAIAHDKPIDDIPLETSKIGDYRLNIPETIPIP